MKIFIVVGTQVPFDRLVKAMDNWAEHNKDFEITAQTGNTTYQAKNIKCLTYLSPVDFDDLFNRSDIIIGHAGTGTIFSALENEKPIIVMPRLSKFNEHRNDHQLSTAKSFEALLGLKVIYDESKIDEELKDIREMKPLKKISKYASEELLNSLEAIIK